MAIKKHKLEMAMEEDFCLLGVVADEPDYKFCWMINRELEINFEKLDDLVLYHPKLDADQEFSIFFYDDEEAMLTYRIVKNRSDKGYFLDELKNLDFLVHIQGEIYKDQIGTFIQSVNSLSSVRMCVPVDLSRLRNKERLLLW
jgi:hypothetical protein